MGVSRNAVAFLLRGLAISHVQLPQHLLGLLKLIEVRGPLHWTVVMRQPASRLLFFLIGIQLAMGIFVPELDTLAHLGGAATGAALGCFLVSGERPFGVSQPRRWLLLGLWLAACGGMVVLAIHPIIGPARRAKIALYYRATDRLKSRRHFRQAVGENPARAFAALDRAINKAILPQARAYVTAMHIRMLGVEPQAAQYYREQAGNRPSADALWLAATLLQEPPAANYDEAAAVCNQGKHLFPGSHDWTLLEASINTTFRRYDRALAVLGDLEDSSKSKIADYWEMSALCHLRRHEWGKAEEATSRCLAASWIHLDLASRNIRDLYDLPVRELRYQALQKLGRADEADEIRAEVEKIYRDSVLTSPDDPGALNDLAWFLATHGGNLEEALILAKQSVERGPQAASLYTVAWIEYLRGDPVAAWATMSQALSDHPTAAPDYAYHAGVILEALGNKQEARNYLQRAVRSGLDFDEFEQAEEMLRKLDVGNGKTSK